MSVREAHLNISRPIRFITLVLVVAVFSNIFSFYVPAMAAGPERREVIPASGPELDNGVAFPVILSPLGNSKYPYNFDNDSYINLPYASYKENGAPIMPRVSAVSPVNGATNTGLTPTLVGRVDGIKPSPTYPVEFEYQVYEIAKGKNYPFLRSDWVSGEWKVPAGKLKANTTYGWSIVARNSNTGYVVYYSNMENEAWFSTGKTQKTVESNDIELALASPARQSLLETLTPTLSTQLIRSVKNTAYQYKFSVRQCANVNCIENNVVADSGWINNTSWKVPEKVLSWNTAYKWSVSIKEKTAIMELIFKGKESSFATQIPVPNGSLNGLDSQAKRIEGVSLSDRHFEHLAKDAQFPSALTELSVSRVYNSSNNRVGSFGFGWSSIFDASLYDVPTGKVVRLSDGHEIGFGKNSNGSFTPAGGGEGTKLESCSSPCVGEFTDQAGSVFRFINTGLSTVTSPDGFITEIVRNAAGKVSSIRDKVTGHSLSVTWSGNKISSIVLDGAPSGVPNKWSYVYAGDSLTNVCRPAKTSECITYGYTASSPKQLMLINNTGGNKEIGVSYTNGVVSSISTSLGETVFSSEKNTTGSRVKVTSPAGATDFYDLDIYGRTIASTNSRGGTEAWKYNKSGKTTQYKSVDDVYYFFRYNNEGLLEARQMYYPDSSNWSEGYTYITSGVNKGKLEYIIKLPSYFYKIDNIEEKALKQFSYDSNGHVSSITLGNNKGQQPIERYTYSTGAEPSVDGGKIPKGLLLTSTDPEGAVTTYKYNKSGLLISTEDPLGKITTNTYDWAGRITTETISGAGIATSETQFSYDPVGRLLSETLPKTTNPVTGKEHQLKNSYTYNAAGQVTTSDNEDIIQGTKESTTFVLDNDGRILETVGPDGVVQEKRAYDRYGRNTEITGIDGEKLLMDYNPQGDLIKTTAIDVKNSTDNSQQRDIILEEMSYDPAGRVSTIVDKNGTKKEYKYRESDQILTITTKHTDNDGKVVSNVEYEAKYYEGLLSGIIENGSSKKYNYDNVGRPISVIFSTDVKGKGQPVREIKRSLDLNGRVIEESVTAASPVRTNKYSYDKGGNLLSEWVGKDPGDQKGVETKYTRDVLGQVIASIEPNAAGDSTRTITYGWDSLGRQVSSTLSDGTNYVTKTGYDAFGNIDSVSQPSGVQTLISYDLNNRPVSVTQPHKAGSVSLRATQEYSPGGKPTVMTDFDGTKTMTNRDSLGQVVSVMSSKNGTEFNKYAFSYDNAGNVIESVDPLGNKTSRTFDWRGNVLSESIGIGDAAATSTYEYDQAGNLIKETSPEGRVTQADYNALGELTSVTEPSGRTINLKRDAAGYVVEQNDSFGLTTWINYDARGNVVRLSDIDPQTKDPVSSWGWEYDGANNQVTQIDPLGTVRHTEYNQRGLATKMINEDGSSASVSYDMVGNPTRYIDPNGKITTTSYSIQGQRTSLIEPSVPGATTQMDRTWRWEYDPVGQITKETRPGNNSSTYSRDAAGNVIKELSVTDGKSSSRTFSYDLAGRLTSHNTEGKQPHLIQYDAAGRITQTTDPVETLQQPTALTVNTQTNQENNPGPRNEQTIDEPNEEDTEYRPQSREIDTPTSEKPQEQTTPQQIEQNENDENHLEEPQSDTEPTPVPTNDSSPNNTTEDNSETEIIGNEYETDNFNPNEPDTSDGSQSIGQYQSLASNIDQIVTDYTYDLDGNLKSKKSGNTVTSNTWDALGKRTSTTLPNGDKYSFSYTNQYLTGIDGPQGKENLQYDLQGNLISQEFVTPKGPEVKDTYTYDSAGQRTSLNSTREGGINLTYEYDVRGRLTNWTENDKQHTITWDAANNVTTIDQKTQQYNARNQLIQSGDTQYTYLPDGRQKSRGNQEIQYDAFGQLTKLDTNQMTYDALGRLTTDGSTQIRYDGLNRQLSEINQEPITYSPAGSTLTINNKQALSDARGDLIGQFDSNGNFITNTYTPFGIAKTQPTGTLGYQNDYQTSGIVNMDTRWYDPLNATFMSRDDTKVGPDEQNRYSYAKGNPLKYSDPTGRFAILIPLIIGISGTDLLIGGGALLGGGLIAAGASWLMDNSSQIGNWLGLQTLPSIVSGISSLRQTTTTTSTTTTTNSYARTTTSYARPANPSEAQSNSISINVASSLGIAVPTINMPNLSSMVGNLSSMNASIQSSMATLQSSMSGLSASMKAFTLSMKGINAELARTNVMLEKMAASFQNLKNININLSAYDTGISTIKDGNTLPGAGTTGALSTCGTNPSPGCLSSLGAKGTSCAASGIPSSMLCSPIAIGGIWANTASTGSSSSASNTGKNSGKTNTNCPPPNILTEVGCEDPVQFLQRKANGQRDKLSQNKELRNEQLSEGERTAEDGRKFLEPMNNGKSMERALGSDPEVFEHFEYVGGPNKPDFVSKSSGLNYELTTSNPKTIQNHLQRSYVDPTRIITYDMWRH